MENMTAKIVMIASEYVLSRKSVRSIIGSALRRSARMNATSAVAETMKSARISFEPHPDFGPSMTA